MANPTTNYGFVLPTSSDLVTDLPADFDVALQGVDTRLKALQPGTTLGDIAYSSATANTNTRLPIGTSGQVLAVSGGVPAWTTPTSGMTNPMTTTGDTIYSSSGSTPARLGIGTTGQVLTVAGGVPTWATSTAGMTQIANTSLSGSATTVSSIPATYKTLFVIINALSTDTNAQIEFTVNSSTSGYAYTGTTRIGATSNFYSDTGDSRIRLSAGQTASAGATSNAYSLNFYNYTSTTALKIYEMTGFTGGSVDNVMIDQGGAWRNTSAITSVTVTTTAGNFDNGTITVFGVN